MYQSYSARMYHPCRCWVTNLDTMGLDGMVCQSESARLFDRHFLHETMATLNLEAGAGGDQDLGVMGQAI